MNQEDINEVMWKSLPQWQKDQFQQEHKCAACEHNAGNNYYSDCANCPYNELSLHEKARKNQA